MLREPEHTSGVATDMIADEPPCHSLCRLRTVRIGSHWLMWGLILHAGGSDAFIRSHVSPERGRIGVRARPLARGSYDSLGTARIIAIGLARLARYVSDS